MKAIARILIIEDDLTVNEQVAALLRKQHYHVHQCMDGEQGLSTALSLTFDLILLDVRLPERNGFSVLKSLRACKKTPVIMVTACGAEEERIQGFRQGADDYLAKPYNITELLFRIEAVLRRTLTAPQEPSNQQQLEVDQIQLNKHDMSLHFAQQAIKITAIQFKLLWALITHKDEVLSKPFLYPLVLDREFSLYDRSLDMHLSRIRKKLIAAGMSANRIETARGRGYCFK
ncbi:MAG: response regulator transcription factor [Colwellia sp.]|nr:response regulator transcription factor [Colwellia sp.]